VTGGLPQAGSRRALKDHGSAVVWLTGLSGAGKTTVAQQLERLLGDRAVHSCMLDGDRVRQGLSRDLGFTEQDRVENIRRVAEVARLMVDAGLIVITALISPFRADRQLARARFAPGEFFEVFVDTPLAVAEQRDPKGLYARARRGELKNFTGIDSPYERPEQPDITIDTTQLSAQQAAARIVQQLDAAGLLPPR
jgi:bifunctional enzyme CysN/CysC